LVNARFTELIFLLAKPPKFILILGFKILYFSEKVKKEEFYRTFSPIWLKIAVFLSLKSTSRIYTALICLKKILAGGCNVKFMPRLENWEKSLHRHFLYKVESHLSGF